ncbi:hypothetical protein L2E82_15123 [Cichorium intybus]|uniref:Uncharacterized protein n=1 Tax=Cichorium intybus TaxID=13427 RepID=A0ACB9F197_CICIN|nr:hypothetical protein L2E82_15123 [Cichorium intybus]
MMRLSDMSLKYSSLKFVGSFSLSIRNLDNILSLSPCFHSLFTACSTSVLTLASGGVALVRPSNKVPIRWDKAPIRFDEGGKALPIRFDEQWHLVEESMVWGYGCL